MGYRHYKYKGRLKYSKRVLRKYLSAVSHDHRTVHLVGDD